MKKLLFIYNPHAGKAQITGSLSEILQIFTAGGYLVTARPTLRQGEAIELAEQLADGYDMVACSGGDGTLCEVVSGMMRLCPSKRPPVGYIPAGSTNDFASTLGISKDMIEAAQNMMHGLPMRCDVGKFNGKYFNYVAAFGAFTSVSYDTPQQIKNILGHTAYVLEGIKQVGSIKPFHLKLEVGEQTIEGDFLYGMVSNTMQIGGMKIPSGNIAVSVNDGLFEVFLVRSPKSIADLQSMITDAVKMDLASKSFLHFKASKITFTSDIAAAWTLDGEFGGECTVATIETCPGAIGIVV